LDSLKLRLMSHAPDVPVFGAREPGREYVYRPSAYAVVRGAAGAVAIMRTPLGHFLPGGGVEAGESAADAAHREAREEAGLLLGPLTTLGRARELVCSVDHPSLWYEKASTFFASAVSGTTASTDQDHELVWMSPDDALAALAPESHRWALERLLLADRS
jgi:8-oxo-dGTP diphosphatase